jgi:hypothetical protein
LNRELGIVDSRRRLSPLHGGRDLSGKSRQKLCLVGMSQKLGVARS